MSDRLPQSRATFVRFSYPHVTSTVALIVALSGGAYAVTALPLSSVGTAQIKAGAVTTRDLHAYAVTAGKIYPHAVGGGQLSSSVLAALGRTGAVGPPGPAGTNGTNGVSVTSAPETAGSNCHYGGSKFTAVSGTTFACNGAPGAPGPAVAPLSYDLSSSGGTAPAQMNTQSGWESVTGTTVHLAAGTYAVSASGAVVNGDTSQPSVVRCSWDLDGEVESAVGGTLPDSAGLQTVTLPPATFDPTFNTFTSSEVPISMSGRIVIPQGAPGQLSVACYVVSGAAVTPSARFGGYAIAAG